MDLTDRPADAAAPHQLPPQERAGDELLARALRRARRADRLRAGTPLPGLARRPPSAVGALVGVWVAPTFFPAGGERMRRIAAAFVWRGVMMRPISPIDVWVTPPPYPGRPPVILP